MDIKEKIIEIAGQITENKDLMKEFKEDPVKAVEKLIGIDVPDDMVEKVVEGVKAKLTLDEAGDALGFLKKLF